MLKSSVLAPSDVANYLNISLTAAYNLFHDENFPSFRVCSRWKVKASDFENWLETLKKRGA